MENREGNRYVVFDKRDYLHARIAFFKNYYYLVSFLECMMIV